MTEALLIYDPMSSVGGAMGLVLPRSNYASRNSLTVKRLDKEPGAASEYGLEYPVTLIEFDDEGNEVARFSNLEVLEILAKEVPPQPVDLDSFREDYERRVAEGSIQVMPLPSHYTDGERNENAEQTENAEENENAEETE